MASQRYRTLDGSDDDSWQLEEYRTEDQRPSPSREISTINLISRATSSTNLRPNNINTNSLSGYPLRRFYFRAAVGVFGPLIVLCYFLAIWRVYLAPIDSSNPLSFGPPGATWVFYSWFVAGVIGLNLSLYGLAGVEAGMLMEPAWHVGDAMRLMLHADGTWSGPGGWMKVLKWTLQTSRAGQQNKLPGRLWFILALPSIVVFVAWPLSGLCLETTEGFLHGRRETGANVTGFSYANFNERNSGDVYTGARLTWKNALEARILGQGIAYTPEGFDRSQLAYLQKVPVVLPKDDGVNRMFLTAQAENPIEGSAWGLLLQYNCSIVKEASDLILLKDREASARKNISEGAVKGSYLPNGSSWVQVMNQTDPLKTAWASNAHAVVELAYELWPNRSTKEALQSSGPNATFTESTTCYFNKNESITREYPGIDQERIFEVLMWQKFFNSSYGDTSPQYNLTIDHNITELYGAYDYLDFAYNIPANQSATYPGWPMTAIGVQCRSSSSVGTADIDGVRSTYSNFERTDTPVNVQRVRCADRFGADILPMMLGPDYNSDEFLSSYFTSTAAPPLLYASYTDDPDSIDAGTGYMVSLNYLQASQLRQSMLHALSSYATQLMFNGGQGFTARDGSQVAFFNPNVTAFVTGTVIKQGVMPAGLPVALFFLWAFISTTLGAMYGFRRRWSAILDGHTLFRLGVELKESDKQAVQKYPSVVEIEDCVALNSVPGLVGDMEPNSVVGRIGLVERNVADKQKLYQ